MFRRTSLLVVSFVLVTLVACSKKTDKDPSPTTGSGSAVAGSAAMGSAAGSAAGSDAGSAAGSAAAGSGSDAGSAGAGAGSGSDAGSGGAAGAAVEFDKLSHEDKVKFMKTKVLPPMKAAFQKFDPKEFANFTCKTCHGKDPQKSKYEMPTPELPKLDFEALKKGEDKEWVEFMEKTVKPEMARILGEPEMTKDSPKGFGCLDCHTQKK